MKKILISVILVILFVPLGIQPATFSFTPIGGCYNCNNAACLGSFINMEVTEEVTASNNYINFTFSFSPVFTNPGGKNDPSITGIYLYDFTGKSFIVTGTLIGSNGADFEVGTGNGFLPGIPPGQYGYATFYAEATNQGGKTKHGINPGESLIINFPSPSGSFEEVLSALDIPSGDPNNCGLPTKKGLIVGLKVQWKDGFETCNVGSCSFIQNTGGADPVSLPPTAVLLGSGIFGFFLYAQRSIKEQLKRLYKIFFIPPDPHRSK